MAPNHFIRIGLTEAHGMATEVSQFPAPGVHYSFLDTWLPAPRIIHSPIKGFLRRYEAEGHDLIEAVLSPVATKSRWIYSCENFQAATAFGVFGCPLPRSLRVAYIKRLLLRENCKKVVFWSQAGRDTLHTYAGVDDEELLQKVTVVYPAIREAPDRLVRFSDGDVALLFSGDFFRKGGVNVVDAFERARRLYPSIRLTLCCDEKIDFNTSNAALRTEYLERVKRTDGIALLGRVRRDELIHTILPETDIYLLPTYTETFGMSVLEAMAFGIPVIATNCFAIPEMLEHDVSGLLIDTKQFDCERLFRGYVVTDIPADFREYVTEHLFASMCRLIESAALRRTLGMRALTVARTKFSFERRNDRMLEVYEEALH